MPQLTRLRRWTGSICAAATSGVLPFLVAAASHASPPAYSETRYEGTLALEAHFAHPGDIHIYHSERRFITEGDGRVRCDWTTWALGDTARVPETFLLLGDNVFDRPEPTAKWQKLSGENARQARLQVLSGVPVLLGRFPPVKSPARPAAVVRDDNGRVTSYVDRYPHVRLGDVSDSVAFSYPGREDAFPATIHVVLHARDEQWVLDERTASTGGVDSALADSLLAPPAQFDSPASDDEDALPGAVVLKQLAPGVWSADMEDIGSRTLIVEQSDGLAVMEMAVSSANGERIVDAIRKQWPKTPIRYAMFSHYHPHYTGGLRAFMAEGATVVTTTGNEAFVKSLAALPFTLVPDRYAHAPKPVHVQTFTDRVTIGDTKNSIVAFNYGKRSSHTDEFVVFWIPEARLLFETELGWFHRNGPLVASRRAATLLAWIKEEDLPVERIVQSWPMKDNESELSPARLQELVDAAAVKK